MGDINVDWAAAPVDRDYTAAALEGVQAGQAQRAVSALRGIDLNNPDSLNKGIGNLVRAGAADQASALMGLQINRSLYNGLPGFLAQTSGGGTQPAQPQADAQPQQDPAAALHAQVSTDARAYAAAPPEQQAAMKPQLEAKYTKLGIPADRIDAALQQASTPEGAQALADGHDAHAAAYSGNPDQGAVQRSLPQGMAPPQQGDGVDPYTWAKNYLSHPQWGAYESMLKSRAGVDLGYTARAQAIMGPEFSAEAGVRNAAAHASETARGQAPYTLDTVTLPNGATMQVPHDTALTLGAGGALHGLTPGAQAQQTAAGTAAGSSPANIQTIKLPGGRERQVTFEPGPNGTYIAKPIPVADSGGTHTAAPTSSPGEVAANTQSNQQLVADRQDVAQSGNRVAILKHVETMLESPQGQTGPGTQAVNGWRNFLLAQAPGVLGSGVDQAKIKAATQDEIKKYMVQIAGSAAAQYGPGTNEKLAVAASGNANPDLSNLANRDVTRMNIALERAKQARQAMFDASGKSGDDYQSFSSHWGRTVDPRAFMLDLLTPSERHAMLGTITSAADRRALVAGKLAAEKAGIFSEADIKR